MGTTALVAFSAFLINMKERVARHLFIHPQHVLFIHGSRKKGPESNNNENIICKAALFLYIDSDFFLFNVY